MELPISRRAIIRAAAAGTLMAAAGTGSGRAHDNSTTIGINLSLTGAYNEGTGRIEYGAMMAFNEENARGGVNGDKITLAPHDDGTATASQYDPGQAATNARKMFANGATLAAISPRNQTGQERPCRKHETISLRWCGAVSLTAIP
jgi:ABC-type branched-subunit amino acid transport system substrate-binding protein